MGYESRAKLLRFQQRKGIMREINLTPYSIRILKAVDGQPQEVDDNYDVKKSLCVVLFHGGQNVSAREAITRDAICKKIEVAGNSILLEEAEYDKVLKSIESLPNVGRNDIEFITRVMGAKEVPVVLAAGSVSEK